MLHVFVALVCALSAAPPVRAQSGDSDPFPRAAVDASGAVVTVPAFPARVAVVGTVPALAQVVPPDALHVLDPAALADVILPPEVGLLLLPELYAAAYPGVIAAADAVGVPVFRVGAVTSLAAWRVWLHTLGHITGRDVAARRAIRRLDVGHWIAGILAHMLRGDASPARVLVLTPERYTVGQGALLTDVIAAAGAVNVAAAAGYADYRQIGDPALFALAPDVILLTPAWGAEGRAAFATIPVYAELAAVAAGRVCLLPFDSTRIARPGWAAVRLALLVYGGCG